MEIDIQEAQRVLNKMGLKRCIPKHFMIKWQKQERMLKAAKEKQVITYKGTPIKYVLPFKEEVQVITEWHYILK